MKPAGDRIPASEDPRQAEPGPAGPASQTPSSHARELLRLVDQSIWASRQWIEFVHSQPDPEPRPRELLGHVMISERIWFERIAGEQKTQTYFPVLDREELLRGLEDNRRTYRD